MWTNQKRAAPPGAEEILVPGELEARSVRKRSEQGMELDETVAFSLAETARKIGLLTERQGFEDMLAW
jgi:LDH2 family malate/lactate/ureidoglycolate dehydrogenase